MLVIPLVSALLINLNVVIAVSKGMQVVKFCSSKFFFALIAVR